MDHKSFIEDPVLQQYSKSTRVDFLKLLRIQPFHPYTYLEIST